MRLFLFALLASVAGTATGVAALYASSLVVNDGAGVALVDLTSFSTLFFVPSLIMCGLFYAPGLFWLRRRRGDCRPARLFVLASGVLLNIPAFLILTASVLSGGFFSGFDEIILFVAAYVVAGVVFGLGFVANCRARRRQPSAIVIGDNF